MPVVFLTQNLQDDNNKGDCTVLSYIITSFMLRQIYKTSYISGQGITMQ